MPENTYRPISCTFHDRLEDHAVRRSEVPVRIRMPDGTEIDFRARILDLFARDGADWVVFSPDITVRLDRLVSVDGVEMPEVF